MHVFERQEDQWILVGHDLAVGPTDIDAEAGLVRLIANGRRLGGPTDGETFKQIYEVTKGQTIELGPNVLLNILDVHPGLVRMSVHTPKHLPVLALEDADRHGGER